MPKREYLNEQNAMRLPELLSSAKEEETATIAKIERWLELADRALGNHPAQFYNQKSATVI